MSQHTVIIIGSGFGGQSAAIALREHGIEDFVILERREFMGGTWLQNTYPGAAVDVQSPLYCLSGEPWDWTQMFAEQQELADYIAMFPGFSFTFRRLTGRFRPEHHAFA